MPKTKEKAKTTLPKGWEVFTRKHEQKEGWHHHRPDELYARKLFDGGWRDAHGVDEESLAESVRSIEEHVALRELAVRQATEARIEELRKEADDLEKGLKDG